MATILEQLPAGSRVAVIRLRSLGDCVLTTPALELLKRARRDVEISVVVEDRFRAVFEGNPDITHILTPRLTAIRQARTDLLINFHGGTRSLALTAASGARWRAGFVHFRGASAYNLRIPRAQEILGEERVVHTAEHLASSIFWLGAPRSEIPRAKLYAERRTAGRPYAVLHPFASAPDKIWPAGGFIAVALHLCASGFDAMFIGASSDDWRAFGQWRAVAGAPLEDIKSLIAGASLFVGNDSGPAHVAAALGVPCVVIFGASNPAIWGPWKVLAETIVARGPIAGVTDNEVIGALERLRVAA